MLRWLVIVSIEAFLTTAVSSLLSKFISGTQVMVDPSDLEGLLGGDDGSDEEGLQHHAGADAALQALIGLKKSGRKKGTMEAQRQGFQIRLRALDLLEVRRV